MSTTTAATSDRPGKQGKRSQPGQTGRRGWSRLLWITAVVVVVAAAVVLGARGLRSLPEVQQLLLTYPGRSALPAAAPVGLPGWLGWQHFLNTLFLVLIIRSGWQVRTVRRPAAHWTRRNSRLFRGRPEKISLDLWFHLTLDALFVVNGVVFGVLLFATGQWLRIVPTSWDVVPNALSAILQYASLDWPTEDGWTSYNALQLLSYFTVVFLATPLAVVTGLRMSAAWPAGARRLNRVYPIELARSVHYPTMLFFVVFVIVHVTLVLATGARRNLNHMYAAAPGAGWTGFWVFAGSIVVMTALWMAARPIVLRPLASLTGKVTR